MLIHKKLVITLFSSLILSACVSEKTIYNDRTTINEEPIFANQVIAENNDNPNITSGVVTTYSLQTNAKVNAAYHNFRQYGIAKTINGDNVITYPYDPYAKPILACAPLNLCAIQLQQGELINDISLGDSAHWMVSTALIGTDESGSYQINIKPKQLDLATDMNVTTNKRSYHLGLVSQNEVSAEIVNFYYPEETLQLAIQRANKDFKSNQHVIEDATQINIESLNFNYQILGDKPVWRPTRVFDDAKKTYIQMPNITKNVELPVLYLVRNKQKQLVNYRYHEPYYIIDGLFEKAYLISGKGREQIKVIITNPSL